MRKYLGYVQYHWGRMLFGGMLLLLQLMACGEKAPPSWQGVIVGKTSHTEVIQLLGEPKYLKDLKDQWVYLYPSERGEHELNTISIKYGCDCVVNISVHHAIAGSEKMTVEEIFEQYGLPEAVTKAFYSYHTVALIYPQLGRLFIVEDGDPVVEKVELFAEHYFVPMSLEQFWGEYGEVWQYDAPEWWDQYVQP